MKIRAIIAQRELKKKQKKNPTKYGDGNRQIYALILINLLIRSQNAFLNISFTKEKMNI